MKSSVYNYVDFNEVSNGFFQKIQLKLRLKIQNLI